MSPDPYNALVRQYFADTSHAGDLDGATVVEKDEQGVRVRLAAAHYGGQIEALRFRAWACPHVIAACEGFCADFEGKPVAALARFRAADIMPKLSASLPFITTWSVPTSIDGMV